MAGSLRIESAGAFYHLTSRGNERRAVFLHGRDREQFPSYLESAVIRYGAVSMYTALCRTIIIFCRKLPSETCLSS